MAKRTGGKARACSVALALSIVAAMAVLIGGRGETARAAGAPLLTRPATGNFEAVGGKIYDPDGVQFVPRGTNLNGPYSYFSVPTAGKSDLLKNSWGFNMVRLTTCLPQGCANSGGFVSTASNDLDAIVAEYTAKKMVVMIANHQLAPGALASPTDIAAMAAWWTTLATTYGSNPYVWFNLYNEPESSYHDYQNPGLPKAAVRWRDQHLPVMAAIRNAGATNMMVVDDTMAGQGAADWWQITPSPDADSGIISQGAALLDADPLRRITFSFHAYDVWGFPNDGSYPPRPNADCPNRYTDAQRDARLRSYLERIVVQRGYALVAGELGYRPTDSPTTGLSYHGEFGGQPPCGSTMLLAADAFYRVGTDYDIGVLSWHGFALVNEGAQTWDLVGSPPSNLTRWGLQHYTYSQNQAARTAGSATTTTTTTSTTSTSTSTTMPPTTTSTSTTMPPTTTSTSTTMPPTTTSTSTTMPPTTTTTAPRQAAVVVGNPSRLSSGDRLVRNRVASLVGSGTTVVYVDDAAAVPSGVRLVVIADTVSPAALGTRYNGLAVPVLVLDGSAWATTGLVAGTPSSFSGTQWYVESAASPLATGLATGAVVTAFSRSVTIVQATDAQLGNGAVQGIARSSSATGSNTGFSYPAGAALPGAVPAPAKRAALSLSDSGLGRITTSGWTPFDNAVRWMLAA